MRPIVQVNDLTELTIKDLWQEVKNDELLSFLACPEAHWRRVRTTNVIEQAFREIRRRTRPMSCFQNTASVDKIIYSVICHLNTTWEAKPLHEFAHLS